MSRRRGSALVLLALATAIAAACAPAGAKAPATQPAVSIEKLASPAPNRITLSARAAERLGIQTAPVEAGTAASQSVIPYAAVVYDPKGSTWAYTNPSSLLFIRAAIAVDHVDGNRAILSSGPSVGTRVVTVGAPELYGAETGVGGGH